MTLNVLFTHIHTLLGAPHTATASGEFISGLAITQLDKVKPSQLDQAPESHPLTLHDSWEGTPPPMLHDAQSRKTDELALTPQILDMGLEETPGAPSCPEPAMSLTDDLKKKCQEVLQAWELAKPFLSDDATPFDMLEKMCGDMNAKDKDLRKKFLDDSIAKPNVEGPGEEKQEMETIIYDPVDPPKDTMPEKKKMDKSYWALLECTLIAFVYLSKIQ